MHSFLVPLMWYQGRSADTLIGNGLSALTLETVLTLGSKPFPFQSERIEIPFCLNKIETLTHSVRRIESPFRYS